MVRGNKDMSELKALEILGLPRNYTADDLKKAYRAQAKMYHSDNLVGASELEKHKASEKIKEINMN